MDDSAWPDDPPIAESQLLVTQEPWTPTIARHEMHLAETASCTRTCACSTVPSRGLVTAGEEAAASMEPVDGTTFRMFTPGSLATRKNH